MRADAPMTADSTIDWPDPRRRDAFERWLAPLAAARGLRRETLRPASADASFRRYLRLDGEAGPAIVMDAPPPHEDVRPFIDIAGRLHEAGLHAPEVLAADVP